MERKHYVLLPIGAAIPSRLFAKRQELYVSLIAASIVRFKC
jgi:hypothetical protein